MLHGHAQELQDTVLKAEHINATLITSLSPAERKELTRRLDTADHVRSFASLFDQCLLYVASSRLCTCAMQPGSLQLVG